MQNFHQGWAYTIIIGLVFYFIVAAALKKREHAEALLQKELEKKEFLFREVHHRIKNNLQMTTSLLSIPLANLTDEDSINIFEQTIHRVQVLALTHQNLYKRSLESSDVKLKSYLEDITHSVAFGLPVSIHLELPKKLL